MATDRQQKALLFVAAAAVRLLLFTFVPALPHILTGRVEVSTPVTSFKRCTVHQQVESIMVC
jgi:phosphatidylinositol glycan class U